MEKPKGSEIFAPAIDIKQSNVKEFRKAMRNKENRFNLYIALVKIIREEGLGVDRGESPHYDPKHLEMARELALKWFETDKRNPLFALEGLSEASGFAVDILPEARAQESSVHKALEKKYQEEIGSDNYTLIYKIGKIAGLLNKDNYRKLFSIVIERHVNDKYRLETAHQYALEGKLYNPGDQETATLLDELKSLEKEYIEIRDKRNNLNIPLLEFREQYGTRLKEINKRRTDILELLAASVETSPDK